MSEPRDSARARKGRQGRVEEEEDGEEEKEKEKEEEELRYEKQNLNQGVRKIPYF